MTWGIHTIIDLTNCNEQAIRSQHYIEKFAKQLVTLIDMKSYGEPQVIHFGDCPSVKGYTLVQLIETSLISAHFVELTNSAYIDIFSCKDYDTRAAAKFTKHFFSAETMIKKVINRGETW